jgi:multiple antibiotic resistance protein
MGDILSYSLTVFMAFFAIMNPMVNIPIFVTFTDGLREKKKKEIAKTATFIAFTIVIGFILIGKYIFQIFGLTIPAFKVFGGVLIFYIGFEMLQSKKSSIQLNEKTTYDENVTISPLAIPILAGPGTIVTAMNFVVNASIFQVCLTIVLFAFIVILNYLAFVYSTFLVKLLGEKNFVIIGKIMGLILGVLGANMLMEGIKLAFNI